MNDNIFIIGNGAIGKVLAVFLKLENKNVTLIRGSIDDGSSYIEEITVTLPNQTQHKAEIDVKTISNFKKLNGLIVLTNKSFANQSISHTLQRKIMGSPLVILHNGLVIDKIFIPIGFPEV